MYSLVLMAALTTGADTVACGHRHGCYGGSSCYGCTGCYGGSSCYGCYGGSSCYGCYGCGGGAWGGCYGSYYGGCYGNWGCYGGCWGCQGVPVSPATPVEAVPAPKPDKKTSMQQPARLYVEMPTDAKLYVDDHLMRTTSERREFRTPVLQSGQTYYYVLKAEIERDGEVVTETQRVLVRAGEQVSASFGDMSAAIAKAKKARLASVDSSAGR